jgi:hypothetical protein
LKYAAAENGIARRSEGNRAERIPQKTLFRIVAGATLPFSLQLQLN